MIQVIRAKRLDREESPQWVFLFEGCLETVFSKKKAWPFSAQLAPVICAELNARFAGKFAFTVEPEDTDNGHVGFFGRTAER